MPNAKPARYETHPSQDLNRAFAARPFQGAEPEKATFLFVGLDANFDRKIDESPIFPLVLEYLSDGVRFWQENRVHHPFRLKEYRGDGRKDGRRYHRTFASIGFGPEHAAEVSFVELLHIPTVATSSLKPADLNTPHLERLNNAIEHGNARHIFVPTSVARLMRGSRLFPWMPENAADHGTPLKVWRKTGSKTVYMYLHLSCAETAEKRAQLKAIGELINDG